MRFVLPPLFLLFLAGATFVIKERRTPAPGPAPAPQAAALASDDPRTSWAIDLAERLGNPAPDAATVALIVAWTNAEDRSDGALNRFNPLNTTETSGAIQTINGDGVRGYSTYEDGMQATVRTLSYGYPGYSEIVAGLASNDPERALRGLYASPWGTSAATTEAVWRSEPIAVGQPAADDTRAQLVAYALSLQGIPYVRGGRSAAGGDCSGTMEHIYLQVTGIDIGGTTFSQYPNLQPIAESELQPGDLWYGQYSDDQHTGMVADVDGDGRWDLINNGGLQSDMHVDYDFLAIDYFAQHTMGFRRAL